MAQRPGVNVSIQVKADGGVSPNAYVPWITAEIRCFWPPRATEQEVEDAITALYHKALEEALDRHRNR